jgi:hypothetical protein
MATYVTTAALPDGGNAAVFIVFFGTKRVCNGLAATASSAENNM